jgi:hypothetical protein
VVSVRHFLTVTGGLPGMKPGDPTPQTARRQGQGESAKSATGYDADKLLRSANRVDAAGRRLRGVLGKQVKKSVDRLSVEPSNNAAQNLHFAISHFVEELQTVPSENLTVEQLRALNQVVDDTTILTRLLESVAPGIAEREADRDANTNQK